MYQIRYRRNILLTICCLLLSALLLQAVAQTDSLSTFMASRQNSTRHKATPPWYVQRFNLAAGVFFPVSNTRLSVGNEDGTKGTTIDLEKDLGFKKSTSTFMADLQWRASRRSRFDLSYFHIDRSSTYTLQKDIQFKDHTYPVDASVNAYFKTDIYRFSYGYALLSHPKYELGLSIGAHIIRGGVGMGLNSSVGNLNYHDDFSYTAPLPDFGIWGGYAFSPRWAFSGEFDYLSITIGDIKGRILGGNFGMMYEMVRNLKVMLSYTGLNIRVEVDKEKRYGTFKWGYNGPSLTVAYAFGRKPW